MPPEFSGGILKSEIRQGIQAPGQENSTGGKCNDTRKIQ